MRSNCTFFAPLLMRLFNAVMFLASWSSLWGFAVLLKFFYKPSVFLEIQLVNYLHTECFLFLFAVLIFKRYVPCNYLGVSISGVQPCSLYNVHQRDCFSFSKAQTVPPFRLLFKHVKKLLWNQWFKKFDFCVTETCKLPSWNRCMMVCLCPWLEELREIQHVTWCMITSFSWESDIWAEFGKL